MNNTEIIISGYGAICHNGKNADEIFNNLKLSSPSPKPKPSFFETEINAPVFEAYYDSSSKIPRELFFAKLAFLEALKSSKLKDKDECKIGIIVGTTVGCMFKGLPFLSDIKKGIKPSMNPVLDYIKQDPAEFLKGEFKLKGHAMTVTTACASGSNAIGIGMEWIKSGTFDIVIAGGTDSIDFIPYSGFNSLMLLSDKHCKPFDRERKGLNLGEGAAFLVLESFEHANKRGISKDILLKGYASNADAYHLTAPHPFGESLEYSILKALASANITSSQIGYINAHGTATRDNDKVEGSVLKKIFGNKTIFSSTKGYMGHTLGAAGAIEAVICILGLKNNWFPLSYGFNEEDNEIGISPLKKHLEVSVSNVLSTSLGFGGVNSALIFGKKD